MVSVASLIGQPYSVLDTPALIVDLDKLEANIATMARTFREAGVSWRPHTKGIKIPALAHKLIAAGAIGVTCAKVSEAEVMACAGIPDILIANQIVGPLKVSRLVALCRHADPIVLVDNPENVRELDAAARQKGVRLRVLVEVDTGAQRCGVGPGEAVVALAREVAACLGLRFCGLQTWESTVLRLPPAEKPPEVERALASVLRSATACRQAGLPVDIISVGGSADYWLSCRVKGVTEIEAGGGIFGDRYYQAQGVPHESALSVLATVISRPSPTRIVTDAGVKAMSTDHHAAPAPRLPGVKSTRLNSEHGIIELEEPSTSPRLGEKIQWEVGYSDFTVHLHETMYGIRGGRIETVWPVQGRGKIQ